MRKILLISILTMAGILPLSAQTGAVQGLCSKGGSKAVTSGISSTNYLDGVIPSCTVTVYLTGTTTKATIYSDNLSTPLANPFTANSATSVNPGGWIFWAATNQGFDVVVSGGIAPNTFPAPRTILTSTYAASSVTPVAGVVLVNTNDNSGITGGPITSSGSISCLPSTTTQYGCVKPDGTTITAALGVLSATGAVAGVSQIVPGDGISVSPGGGTGVVTVTNTGSFNPPNTNYVWMGDSRLMIATFNQVTATAASMDGTTVTITLPNVAGNWVDNTALVAGDSVQFFNNANNWSPSCLGWGNGTVLTASATQITVAQNSLGPVTCTGSASGTGGVVQKANYLVPQLTAREPYFLNHGTTYNMAVPGEATNTIGTTYTNYVHALSPAVTGNPGYLILQVGSQNGLGCTAVATVESQLQTFWATAHADGWTIIETTLITAGPTISCPSDYIIDQVNYWLRSQVKGYDATLTAAGKYWDQLVDVATYVGDLNDPNIFATGSENLHFNNGGTKVVSSLMNLSMVAKGSIPQNPRTGYSVGPQLVDTTPSASAGYGPSVFDKAAWASNATPGIFSMTIDKATPASYVNGFIEPTGNLPMTGFRKLPWNGSTVGIGWLMRYNGGYCWLAQSGGAYMSQLATETCLKRVAAKEVVLGDGATWADASGQLDLATILLQVASDPASPVNGMVWYNTTTNLLKAYINGVVTTLGAGGGGTTTNALTGAASGGAAPGATFNGSAAVTFDYHTLGAGGLAAANSWTALNDFSAGINLSGTTSPLQVGGSAGTASQCLVSAGAGATPAWGSCASGSSPLTTKGDLFGFSTVDARIPVGADTQVLTADSTQPLGVKWAAPPSGTIGYGFTLNTGVAASPAFPNQIAPRTGSITACKFLTQASDGATALTFNIKEAGVSILSGSSATIAAGTASQTITTLTLTGTISVTAGDIWEFDITGGTSTWTGSLTCY